ncbi:MAG TPA: C40 family peptidase [Nocardioidaceae bacterium]|nr:C40 family peptidase [Nocardioidaceae bacterium]
MSLPTPLPAPLPAPLHVPVRRMLVHVLVVIGALIASSAAFVPAADAMSRDTRARVMKIAASKKGTPYRYGATGPSAFDCSGYTRWVFRKVGRHLPRTSRAQARHAKHVSRSQRRTGDLVFFRSGGRVYHVAIYAGSNRIWHSPRSGSTVHRARLWTSSVSYGRIR